MSTFLEDLRNYENLIQQAKQDLQELYLNEEDQENWAVAWSGGKDSTCVLKLITEVVMELPKEKRKRHIYAVMSDTIVENPELDLYMRDQVKLFNNWASINSAPFSAHIVERKIDHGYFSCLLGKGYPLPSQSMRWCTDRLKLKPQENFLIELKPSYILSGVRKSESKSRETSIKKRSISEKIANYTSGKLLVLGTKIFMPIVDFDVEDVWRNLREATLWSDTESIRRIYKDATGECGFINPKGIEEKKVEVCGARFGCWTCPVITQDKSTDELAKTYQWMKPLTEWRTLQMRIHGRYTPMKLKGQTRKARSLTLKKFKSINHAVIRMTKAGFGRNGKEYKVGAGTLTLEARIFLTEELIKTQAKLNQLRTLEGLEEIEIIRQKELDYIYDLHQQDQRENHQILKNKLGIPFDRQMLLENINEHYIQDINQLENLSTDEIADLIVENYKKSIYTFPTN